MCAPRGFSLSQLNKYPDIQFYAALAFFSETREVRFGETPVAPDPNCRPASQREEGRAISTHKAQPAECSYLCLQIGK